MNKKMQLAQIGEVSAREGNFAVTLNSEFAPALKELGSFSHALVLWWADQLDSQDHRKTVTVDSPYKGSPAKMGIFATRSPVRPNPVMISCVQIISVDEKKGILNLAWIDAADSSPVIDIKPYSAADERVRDFKVPSYQQNWPSWYEDSAEFDWGAVFNF